MFGGNGRRRISWGKVLPIRTDKNGNPYYLHSRVRWKGTTWETKPYVRGWCRDRRLIVMTERVDDFSRDDGTTISWPIMGRSRSTMGSSPPGGTTWTSVSSPRKCAGEQSSCDGISDRDGCSRTPRLRDQRRASAPVLGHSFLRRFAQRSNGCDHGVFLQPVGLEMAVRIVHLVVVPPKEVDA